MGYLFHNLSNIWNTFQQGCQNWPVLLFVFKYWVKGHATCTVPTGPNLPPKRTPEEDPGFALGQLWVRFLKSIRFGFAKGLLWVCSGSARGPLCVCTWGADLRTHAWSGLRSVVTAYKPAPCIFQIHCPVGYGGNLKHTHVQDSHGEHQQNHQNFDLYSAKNC